MEYQADFVLNIIQNMSEVITAVGLTSIIGFLFLFCGIVIYVKYPRNKWQEKVKQEIECSETIPLEYLANSNDLAITKLAEYLATVDYAIISNDGTVYSTALILNEIKNEQLREGRVQVRELQACHRGPILSRIFQESSGEHQRLRGPERQEADHLHVEQGGGETFRLLQEGGGGGDRQDNSRRP